MEGQWRRTEEVSLQHPQPFVGEAEAPEQAMRATPKEEKATYARLDDRIAPVDGVAMVVILMQELGRPLIAVPRSVLCSFLVCQAITRSARSAEEEKGRRKKRQTHSSGRS